MVLIGDTMIVTQSLEIGRILADSFFCLTPTICRQLADDQNRRPPRQGRLRTQPQIPTVANESIRNDVIDVGKPVISARRFGTHFGNEMKWFAIAKVDENPLYLLHPAWLILRRKSRGSVPADDGQHLPIGPLEQNRTENGIPIISIRSLQVGMSILAALATRSPAARGWHRVFFETELLG